MSILVIMSSKAILLYPIQTKILLLNLLFKYSNKTQIFLLKDILSKVKPNKPKVVHTILDWG